MKCRYIEGSTRGRNGPVTGPYGPVNFYLCTWYPEPPSNELKVPCSNIVTKDRKEVTQCEQQCRSNGSIMNTKGFVKTGIVFFLRFSLQLLFFSSCFISISDHWLDVIVAVVLFILPCHMS